MATLLPYLDVPLIIENQFEFLAPTVRTIYAAFRSRIVLALSPTARFVLAFHLHIVKSKDVSIINRIQSGVLRRLAEKRFSLLSESIFVPNHGRESLSKA